MDNPITLVCGSARALIDPRGAELRSWRAKGLDLLWTPEAPVWPAVSPILFPIVGRLREDRLRIGAFEARMGVHGFAAGARFAATRSAENAVRFLLCDGPETRAIYPFRFALAIEYRLTETALDVSIVVENADEKPLPYACGLHPGFCWPFDGGAPEDYRLIFEMAESAWIPEITPEGLFGAGRRRSPAQGSVLALRRDLFAHEALCFLECRSRAFRFAAPTGRAIAIETSDFPHFALWSRPPAPFLCLESWTGRGDPADFSGDLFEKPSMRRLAPGAQARHQARYALV